MTIVVTGATGELGRHVVRHLLARGVKPAEIIAGGRNEEVLETLSALGVLTARIDYSDPSTLDAAFAGADKVLLISGSEVGKRVLQHKAVIDAARKVGAGLVYTSAPKASTSSLILAPDHKATEEMLEQSGLSYTVLRNNWYFENYNNTILQAAQTGSILTSAGDGRVASATRSEYAEAAAVALLSDQFAGDVLELGGDHAWDIRELADAVEAATGREVRVDNISADKHVAALPSFGLDEGTAGFVAALDANIADGLLADTDGSLARLIGRPTTSLKDYVQELIGK